MPLHQQLKGTKELSQNNLTFGLLKYEIMITSDRAEKAPHPTDYPAGQVLNQQGSLKLAENPSLPKNDYSPKMMGENKVSTPL